VWPDEDKKMIRHCVFVRFRNDVADAERAAIHADLGALRRAIDGMDAVKFSANVSPEPFARGFTHGFTIDFHDAAARDAYLVHEAHQRAGASWSQHLKAAPTG
jgi:hypothetical protein